MNKNNDKPKTVQLINNTLSIVWTTGQESYLTAQQLRLYSPSAQNKGERDIFGKLYGGHNIEINNQNSTFKEIKILSWELVGNYAMRIQFSDGHNTGIYSWDYIQNLEK